MTHAEILAAAGLTKSDLTGGTLAVHSPIDGAEIARVSETKAEARMATVTTTANSLKTRPITPPSSCSRRPIAASRLSAGRSSVPMPAAAPQASVDAEGAVVALMLASVRLKPIRVPRGSGSL